MKRLAQRATKKKKTGVSKPSSQTNRKQFLTPVYLTVPGSKNVTDPYGEIYLRNYQFPTTIYEHMRRAQVEKLNLFIEGMKNFTGGEELMIRLLNRAPKLHAYEPLNGCTRWVYDGRYFADGQDRYEAVDDVSFDVLGTFCPSCELSRRLVESKPIHYEVPEENQVLTPSMAGFMNKNWTWALLVMICTSLEIKEVSEILGAYVCGHRRVYVGERPEKKVFESMDFQRDFLDALVGLEQLRYFDKAMIRICLNEFKPFIDSEDGDDHLFYSPSLTLNLLSGVIYGLSVKMYLGDREHVFHCSKPGIKGPLFREIREMETFPEDPELYPMFYTGMGGFAPLIVYSLFYLNEDVPGEFHRVIMEDPQQFLKIVGGRIVEVQEFRERLINYKRNVQIIDFSDSVLGLRKCLGGLGLKK
jgi:hypothetical protein